MPNPYVDFDAIKATLYDISSECRKAMDTRFEHFTLEDADLADPEVIVGVYLDRLIYELDTIGITVMTSLSNLFNNWYTTENIIKTLGYVLPITLYSQMESSASYRTVIKNIIETSADATDALHQYLEFLEKDPDTREASSGVNVLLDVLVASDIFVQYLKQVLDRVTIQTPAISTKGLSEYANRMTIFENRWNLAVSLAPKDLQSGLNMAYTDLIDRINDDQIFEKCVWFYGSDISTFTNIEMGVWESFRNRLNVMLPIHRDHYKTTQDRTDVI